MKLSEKALKKIQDEMEHGEYQIPCGYENVEGMSIYHLEEHEFEPDDFEDCVVLTVMEVKEIAFKLKELSEGYFLSTGNIDSRSVEWSIVLNERIEQTEEK